MFSELFSSFYFHDAQLFMKMYIQGVLRALITNVLLYLQIRNGGSNMTGKFLKKFQFFRKKIVIYNLLSDLQIQNGGSNMRGNIFKTFQFFGGKLVHKGF